MSALVQAWPGAGSPALGAGLEHSTGGGSGLEAFGKVLCRSHVVIGPYQDVCLGDRFYGPGVPLEFGVLIGKFRDRVYFRTDKRIIREWNLPAPGQPDSALAWASRFVAQFAGHDTLFVEQHTAGDPVLASGDRALRMGALFRRWVAEEFTAADIDEAAALGIPSERLMGPPPERICPLGTGGG